MLPKIEYLIITEANRSTRKNQPELQEKLGIYRTTLLLLCSTEVLFVGLHFEREFCSDWLSRLTANYKRELSDSISCYLSAGHFGSISADWGNLFLCYNKHCFVHQKKKKNMCLILNNNQFLLL
uniref:Uncharacterized protein n=1 Tax=Micrurus corallinus TaxID=54390 RepID=A0A2D4EW68_MICCO